jgi:hypothetical protein
MIRKACVAAQAVRAIPLVGEQTMTQHTPGPWTANDDGSVTAFLDDGVIDEVICSLIGVKIDASFFTDVPGQTEANTRLIAAAPDLLEACRQLAKLGDWTGPTPAGFTEAWECAVSAIAKATAE